jgi:hypothetical protein
MTTVQVSDKVAEIVRNRAKKEHRTIKGQLEIMVELAMRQIEERELAVSGATQLDPAVIQGGRR